MNERLQLDKLKVFPLSERKSLSNLENILADPQKPAPRVDQRNQGILEQCASDIKAARQRGAAVMLIYGAHLLRNGAALILDELMANGWVTHLATNGAGTIHDWEFAWFGRSTESVEQNVATGTFGTWDETGRNINLAILAGGANGLGYGESLGKFIAENGALLPGIEELKSSIVNNPLSPLTPARAELAAAMQRLGLSAGKFNVPHPYSKGSIAFHAFQRQVPFTVHPGIGYDIISNHPLFSPAAIGRGAGIDFQIFGGSVEHLDGGVVISVGSAIMGPQVFEKALSCVNNLRLQAGRKVVEGHAIYVVDLQDAGGWDWTQGEPPKTNPAYYLRFCKSFSRMGGRMQYAQCDNLAFAHQLLHLLKGS